VNIYKSDQLYINTVSNTFGRILMILITHTYKVAMQYTGETFHITL